MIGAAALVPDIDVPPSRQYVTELQAHRSRYQGTLRVDFDHERDLKDDGGQEGGISIRYPSIAVHLRTDGHHVLIHPPLSTFGIVLILL